MHRIFKFLSLLLAIIMLASCVIACNNTPADDTTSDNADTIPDADVVVSNLPEMDWEGAEFRVLGRDGGAEYSTIFSNFEITRDEMPEDVVGQAIYERNRALYNKYNFKVVQNLLIDPVNEHIQVMYESGDDVYDLVMDVPKFCQSHAQSGYLLNINSDLKYIDLDHPSWNSYVNKQLTIGGKLYYTISDFMLHDKHRTQFLFYNRDLAADLNLGFFEDFVDNNTWTLAKMKEVTKAAYADIDGKQGITQTDRFGLGMENYGNFAGIIYSAGFRLTEMDKNGYPKLVGATDLILNIVGASLDITGNKQITYVMEDYYYTGANPAHEYLFNYFLEGNVLMLTEFTSFYDEWLHQATIEIGALPNPKYDSSQSQYCTYPYGTIFAVPYTVLDTDKVGFCLEALTEASTDTTYITYRDTKCKYQDAYDEDCARMLDLCFDGTIYDVGAFCNFGGMHSGVSVTLQKAGTNSYKRLYDTYRKSAQKAIDALIEDYSK